MSIPARVTKANGSTDWADGETLTATHLNGDINPLYTTLSGGIEDDNVASGAAIDPTKIDDYAASVTEARKQSDPGVSDAESQATSLAGELERLRYALSRLCLGTAVRHYDGTNTEQVFYGDSPLRGTNLVRNPSFEVKTTGSTAAPDGWALVGSPTSVTQTAAGVTNGAGYALRVVARASNADGVSQTFANLKASTKYLIHARVKVNTAGHTVRLVTTGAISSGSFRNVDLSTSSTSYTQLSAYVQTDGTPTNLVVQFIGSTDANADSFDIDNVSVRECNNEPFAGHGYVCVQDSSTDTTGSIGTSLGAFPPNDQLSAAVTCPGPGYTIRVTATGNATDSDGAHSWVMTLKESGSQVAVGSSGHHSAATGSSGSAITYVKLDPTPGTTYTYTTEAAATGSPGPNGSHATTGVALESRLVVELIPQAS